MKLKLAVLVQSSEPLSKLMNNPMPSATAFKCAKVLKAVSSELEAYEEARKKAIETHGKDGEISEKSKNWDKFVKELNELLATDVKLDVEKVKSENLSKVEVSPTDLIALDWLIEE